MTDRLTLAEVADRLPQDADVMVVYHVHPDGDCIGCALGLCSLLQATGCRVTLAGDDAVPARLAFMCAAVTPDRYLLTDTVTDSDVPDNVITVDCAAPKQIGRLYERIAEKITLSIDHHAQNTPYAPGLVIPTAAACAEIVFALGRRLIETGRIAALPGSCILPLYAALCDDTGCFKFANVTPATHRVAADMMEYPGIDFARVNRLLYESKDIGTVRAEAIGMRNLHLYHDGKIAVISIGFHDIREAGLTSEHLGSLIDIPRGIAGVEVAVSIRQETDEPVFHVSTRSNGSVNVADICACFGGGGHKGAAGCHICLSEQQGMEEAEAALVRTVEKYLPD